MRLYTFLALIFCMSTTVQAQTLPDNDLYKEDNPFISNGISKEEFNGVIDSLVKLYQPIIGSHKGLLVVSRKWDDSTVNASAMQLGPFWLVNMYGGLARRAEVTQDAFVLVMCHELGHHLAGFPFVGGQWAANEGQADYFATQVCSRALWSNDTQKNAEAVATVDPIAKEQCDRVHEIRADRELCYRTNNAGFQLALLLSRLNKKGTKDPAFSTPDNTTVHETSDGHPAAQCRLDTYLQGSLCKASFDSRIIPGKDVTQGRDSVEAETEAAMQSCTHYSKYAEGLRPSCWFKARL